MQDRSNILTELRNPKSMSLDSMPTIDAVRLMNEEDRNAIDAVASIATDVARAVDIVAERLSHGGKLTYVGAGTSGRLGVLDASECPPTFGVDPNLVSAIIAGGPDAVFRSKEGAEDDRRTGFDAIDLGKISEKDVVIGIAASGSTPFVIGALEAARSHQAATIFITCVRESPRDPIVDLTLRALTGPEILTGSTRLKAGTATKLILNQITTLTMVRLGKVYENLMVDLRASNDKLRERSIRIVRTLTGLSVEDTQSLLKKSDGSVKTAIVMHQLKVSLSDAQNRLKQSGGSLRRALEMN